MAEHQQGCACVVCNKSAREKTCVKVCISVDRETWEAFSDECLLMGEQKSPTITKLMRLFLKKRKEARS